MVNALSQDTVTQAQPALMPLPTQRKYSVSQAVMYAILITASIVAIFPFLWMISTSLMTLGETINRNWVPAAPQVGNYAEAWEDANFGKYFMNSVFITFVTIAGMLTTSILAGYAFARINFIGRNVIFSLLLITLMIPESVTMIPNFLMVNGQIVPLPNFNDWVFILIMLLLLVPPLDYFIENPSYKWVFRAGVSLVALLYIYVYIIQNPSDAPLLSFDGKWMNNIEGLTVPFMASAFSIFMLRQFFMQLPPDLWDAARIDGCGHMRFLLTVVLPISKAPVLTVTLLTFIGAWNDFLWPLIVTNTDQWRPLMVGLYNFTQDAGTQTHLLMAGSFITILPMMILYFMTQKTFTEGIATTGLKG